MGYKTASRRTEVPEVLYLGHSKKEAKAVQVPEGFLFIETQVITPGYGRRFRKGAKRQAKAANNDSIPPAPEAGGEGSKKLGEPPAVSGGGDDYPLHDREGTGEAKGSTEQADDPVPDTSPEPAPGDEPKPPESPKPTKAERKRGGKK